MPETRLLNTSEITINWAQRGSVDHSFVQNSDLSEELKKTTTRMLEIKI